MAPLGEGQYSKTVCGELVKYGQVSKIESHATSIGIPDLNFHSKSGWESWIELKWYGMEFPMVRASQVAWHRERWKVGINSWFLVGTSAATHILIPGSCAESLKLNPDWEEWKAYSYGIWEDQVIPPMSRILDRMEMDYEGHQR